MDPRLALPSSSGTVVRGRGRFDGSPDFISLSMLVFREEGDCGGEANRMGVSWLAERRLKAFRSANCGGMAGSGGTLIGPDGELEIGPELLAGRPGDRSRKVRVDMEAELLDLRRP